MSVHIFSQDCMNKKCDTIYPYAAPYLPKVQHAASHSCPFHCCSSKRTEERNKLNSSTMTKCLQTANEPSKPESDKSSKRQMFKEQFLLSEEYLVIAMSKVGNNLKVLSNPTAPLKSLEQRQFGLSEESHLRFLE